MDTTEVTNEQFAKFAEATGYTIAERTPRAEDFPGAPAENLGRRGVLAARPCSAAEQSLVVVVREGRELASSRRARERPRGARAPPGVQVAAGTPSPMRRGARLPTRRSGSSRRAAG
jgi:formylglycine-generating enzyme required for sulfatase activity